MPSGIYLGNKGKKVSEKTKQKLKEKRKLQTIPPCLGRKLSEEQKRQIGKSNSGSKSHFWKGGIHITSRQIRGSREYKLWRKSVFERDNYTCIWCGSKEKIEIDHIKPFSLFPELRFALDNGRALCQICHKTTSTYGNRKLYRH